MMETTMKMDCVGFRKLMAAAKADEEKQPGFHNYGAKVAWVVERARHYAEKTGLAAEVILDAWEERRSYWYMNYYQESQQPLIEGDQVRVFESVADLMGSIGEAGFRCPACGEVSKSPYECDAGGVCDWKVYGLFGHMGKGVTVFVKEKVRADSLFMPVAWEVAGTPES